MIWVILSAPAIFGILSMLIRDSKTARLLLLGGGMLHFTLTIAYWFFPGQKPQGEWIGLDGIGLLFLTITSVLFLASAVYGIGYLRGETEKHKTDFEEGFIFSNSPETRFIGCMLFFLSAMSLVTVSRNFGLLWVAVEATTLASAPLIYFHQHHRSLEAAWKYLLICSVGIALALLGNFFLNVAGSFSPGSEVTLSLNSLLTHAKELNPTWLKASFLLLLVGYGTKMGLAPMHTWLPDAHSESPSMVSALLSGSLLNCAFLGILRLNTVMIAAGFGELSGSLLMIFGLISMVVAALFIIRQMDFKRLLAYSSVEHMGILALGAGIGGVAGVGSMLHAVNHSLAKAMLFLVAGNILSLYHTKSTGEIRRLVKSLPISGALWLIGLLAITGSPPFGLFTSELMILKGTLSKGYFWYAGLYLLALGVIFAAMSRIVLKMVYGQSDSSDVCPAKNIPSNWKETTWSVTPPAVLCLGVLLFGLYIPPGLMNLLEAAAQNAGIQ